MSKISTAQHASDRAVSHKSPRSRFGTAFVAGCLALSVCPALAFAAPGDQGAPNEQNGNPPAAMQFDENGSQQQGQAPDWNHQAPNGMEQGGAPDINQTPDANQAPDENQAPSDMPQGQAPDGQQGPNAQQAPNGQQPFANQAQNDAMSDQVRQILVEKYGIELPTFGDNETGQFDTFQPGDPADAPELPEGAVNVQQVIDTARDVLRQYGSEDLSTKLADTDFVAALKAFALSSTEQRLAMFASNARPTMEAPADLPSDEAAPAEANSATLGTAVDESVMSSIINLIMDVFEYVS